MTQQAINIKELGTIISCSNCGKPTYDSSVLPETPVLLPEGFTNGQARRFVTVRSVKHLVCTNCRYDVFGAW